MNCLDLTLRLERFRSVLPRMGSEQVEKGGRPIVERGYGTRVQGGAIERRPCLIPQCFSPNFLNSKARHAVHLGASIVSIDMRRYGCSNAVVDMKCLLPTIRCDDATWLASLPLHA